MPTQKIGKEDIVRNALLVFKEQGYHHTTMSDIGKACGLLKGSLYHHFSGKEQLMEAVLENLNQYYEKKIFQIADNPDLAPADKLRYLIEKSVEIFLTQRVGCLMASIGLETTPIRPSFSAEIQRFFTSWAQCMESILTELGHPHAQVATMAWQSVAEVEGGLLLAQVFQDDTYLHNAHKNIYNRFLNNSL
jgi:TetR/AcrR family transcriptional repressor of nem operon